MRNVIGGVYTALFAAEISGDPALRNAFRYVFAKFGVILKWEITDVSRALRRVV